jgi:hypothetical protein
VIPLIYWATSKLTAYVISYHYFILCYHILILAINTSSMLARRMAYILLTHYLTTQSFDSISYALILFSVGFIYCCELCWLYIVLLSIVLSSSNSLHTNEKGQRVMPSLLLLLSKLWLHYHIDYY